VRDFVEPRGRPGRPTVYRADRPPEPRHKRQRLVERFVWLRNAGAGWWQVDVGAGAEVAAGERLGAILDPFGDELETIMAPEPGVVLFLTTSPAVADDGLLLGLGGGMQPYL
jgi:predicted deacylase